MLIAFLFMPTTSIVIILFLVIIVFLVLTAFSFLLPAFIAVILLTRLFSSRPIEVFAVNLVFSFLRFLATLVTYFIWFYLISSFFQQPKASTFFLEPISQFFSTLYLSLLLFFARGHFHDKISTVNTLLLDLQIV